MLTTDLSDIDSCDAVFISVNSQGLRKLCEELNKYDMDMSNGKKKSKFNPMLIMYIVIGAACGFFGADLMDRLENNGVSPFVSLIFMMAAFLLSFLIVPIIHESGHLVMGLLTGYDFVSFRVGSFTVIKENGKLVRKKFNIAGTGGQCILTKEIQNP